MPIKKVKWRPVFLWLLAAAWPAPGFPPIPEAFAGPALALAACLALLCRGRKGSPAGNAIRVFQFSANALAQYAVGSCFPSVLQG